MNAENYLEDFQVEVEMPFVVDVFTASEHDPYVTLALTVPKQDLKDMVRYLGLATDEDFAYEVYEALCEEVESALGMGFGGLSFR